MISLLKRHSFVVQLLLIFIGLTFIVLWVTVLKNNRWGMPLNSLGSAILAATFVSILQSAFGIDIPSLLGQRLLLNTQVYEMGLTALHPRIGDESIFARFERAESIDILYNTAKNTSYRYLDRIEQAIELRRCKVRVLVSDPSNLAWGNPAIGDALCPGTDIAAEVKDVTNRLKLMAEELRQRTPPLKGGSLELRLLACLPTGSIVIVDNEAARFTPYFPYTHSNESPSFDAAGAGRRLFTVYKNTFERAWSRSQSSVIINVDFTPASGEQYLSLKINNSPPE